VDGHRGWRWWIFLAACGLALAWLGCPQDDDDSAGDDDAGDDDAADDDSADDDSADPYSRSQDLSGTLVSEDDGGCTTCTYTFEITYLTDTVVGSCSACSFFADGVYLMAYDNSFYGGGAALLYGYGGKFYYWYAAYPGAGGHTLEFYYQYGGFTQFGYWDVAGDTMTGKTFYTEP